MLWNSCVFQEWQILEPVFVGLSDPTGFGYRALSLMQIVETVSVLHEFKDSTSQGLGVLPYVTYKNTLF